MEKLIAVYTLYTYILCDNYTFVLFFIAYINNKFIKSILFSTLSFN